MFKGENAVISVHNHPNNSMLSFNDIYELMTYKSLIAVVAVGNDGGVCAAIKNINTLVLSMV